jgi:hypothetical protein
MTDVQAALDAMTKAEQEARGARGDGGARESWAYDRLRLIERDRESLDLHQPDMDGFGAACAKCGTFDPCEWQVDIVGYWTRRG